MWLVQILRIISIYTDYTISVVLDFLFQLLNNIAFVQLKSTMVTAFANRVYVFLGVIMLFKLAFSFITYIINPDSVEDKTKGAAATFKNLFICLILIFTVPMIFKAAFTIQNEILNKNLIPRLILGMEDTHEGEDYFMRQGRQMTFSVYSALITPNEAFFAEEGDPLFGKKLEGSNDENSKTVTDVCSNFYELKDGIPANAAICTRALYDYKLEKDSNPTTAFGKAINFVTFGLWGNVKELFNRADESKHWTDITMFLYGVKEQRSIPLLNMYVLSSSTYLNNDGVTKEFLFNYMVITPLITLFIAYVVLIFCFDVAVRVIKLGFLQIIAPVPIISYIDPKSSQSGMFKKWVSTCVKTYIDLFIRIGIIYFALFIIGQIDSGGFERADGGYIGPFVKIFLILGILKFAKDFPKLLQDITGLDLKGDFTLSLGKKLGDIPGVGRLAQKGVAGGMAMFGKDMKGANLKERITHGANVARKNNEIGWMGDNKKSIFSNTETKRIKESREKKYAAKDSGVRNDVFIRRGQESLAKQKDIKNVAQGMNAGFSADFASSKANVESKKKDVQKASTKVNRYSVLNERGPSEKVLYSTKEAKISDIKVKYNGSEMKLSEVKKQYGDNAEIESNGRKQKVSDFEKSEQILYNGKDSTIENARESYADSHEVSDSKGRRRELKEFGASPDEELVYNGEKMKASEAREKALKEADSAVVEYECKKIDASEAFTLAKKDYDDKVGYLEGAKKDHDRLREEHEDDANLEDARKEAQKYMSISTGEDEEEKTIKGTTNSGEQANSQKEANESNKSAEDNNDESDRNQNTTNSNVNSKRLNEIAIEINGLNSLIADKYNDLEKYNEKTKEFESDKSSASYIYWNKLRISTQQNIEKLELKREELFNEMKELKGE